MRRARTEPRLSPPVAGFRSLGIAAATFVLLAAVITALPSGGAAGGETIRQRMFEVGAVLGLLSAGAWISSAMTRKSSRVAWVTAGVLAAALWLASNRPPDRFAQGMLLYLSIGSGLVLAQGAGFYLLRVPRWRRTAAADGGRPGTRQYGIAEVLLATTAMAVLLALARRYAPPIDPLAYWLVMAAVWLWLPLLSGLIAHTALRPAGVQAAVLAAAALSVGVAGASGLTVLEMRLGEQPPEQWQPLLSAYLTFAATYAAVIAAIARGGRDRVRSPGFSRPPGQAANGGGDDSETD